MSVARVGGSVPKIADDQCLIFQVLQRFECRGKFEVLSLPFGRPLRRVYAIGHVENGHADGAAADFDAPNAAARRHCLQPRQS